MASRTEGAGTERQGKVIPGIPQMAMHRHFSGIAVPHHFGSIFGQGRLVSPVGTHAVQTQFVILPNQRLAFTGIPPGIRIARLACQIIGKCSRKPVGLVAILTVVSKTGTLRIGRIGVGKSPSCIAVPRMLQEIEPRHVREQGRHVGKCLHIGREIARPVMPDAIAVEARSRSTCCPKLVIILQYRKRLIGIFRLVIQQESRLCQDTHVLLPEMIVEDMVFFHTALLLIRMTQGTHHQIFRTRTLRGGQASVEQIVNRGMSQSQGRGRKVIGKELCVRRRQGEHRIQ